MLDKNFIKQKIDYILRDLGRLELFRGLTIDEVAVDPIRYASFKTFLIEIIGRGIDINYHIILEQAIVTDRSSLTHSETFLYLGKLGIFPDDFAKKISDSAGFRNAIIHRYDEVDPEIVYKTVGEAINQYAQYCDYILKFIHAKKVE